MYLILKIVLTPHTHCQLIGGFYMHIYQNWSRLGAFNRKKFPPLAGGRRWGRGPALVSALCRLALPVMDPRWHQNPKVQYPSPGVPHQGS